MTFSDSRLSKLPSTSRFTKNSFSFSWMFFYDLVDFRGANPALTLKIWPSCTPAESRALISFWARLSRTNNLLKLVLVGYDTSLLRYLASTLATILSFFDSFFVSDLFLSLFADEPSISENLLDVTDAKVSCFLARGWSFSSLISVSVTWLDASGTNS